MTGVGLAGVVADETWEPGDPLYGRHTHSSYFFNFRDDPAGADCTCADAARWPEPPTAYRRIEDDPFAEFVAEHRAWARRAVS